MKVTKKAVRESLKWADEIAESWVGTTTGSIIDSQKRHVETLMKTNDLNLVSIAVLELVQTCKEAEQSLNGQSKI